MEYAMSEEQPQITVKEMDNLIAEMRDAKSEYTAKNNDAKEAKTILDSLQAKLLDALETLDKDTYIADAGRITRVRKLTVRVPKTLEAKRSFFKFLEETQGKDVADSYMSVNSQSLNSLYNQLVEEYAERGEVLEMDGIETPTFRESLSFRQS